MSGCQVSLFDYIDFAIAPGFIPSEFQLQKILRVALLRVRLAAILDFNARKFRTKVSIKEQLFKGSIRYLPREQEIEYRKRFQLFGIAPAYAWARWDLRRLSPSAPSSPAWQPRIGFGLGLGGGGSPLLLFGGGLRTAGALLAQGSPLSFSFKAGVGSREGPGLRSKGYFDLSVPLPRSFGDDWGGGGEELAGSIDGDRREAYGGEYEAPANNSNTGGGAVRLLLRRTALVLTL